MELRICMQVRAKLEARSQGVAQPPTTALLTPAHTCKCWHACGYLCNAYERNGPILCLFHAASSMQAMVVVTKIDMVYR